MRTWPLLLIPAALIACSSDANEGTTGSGGSGAAGGSTTTGGTGGTATGVGGSGGTTGAGGEAPMCYGDQAAWDAILKTDIACSDASDCCVVANQCTAEAYMVHADDYEAAEAAWPWCDDGCANCLPPDVAIDCVNDVCVGSVDSTVFNRGVSHCGMVGTTLPPDGDEGTSYFTCDGAI
jgi:hypothetical protein